MQGEQLTRQWQILKIIEYINQSVTLSELAEEDCRPRTIWQDLTSIQNPQLFLLFQFNPTTHMKPQLSRQDLERKTHAMATEVGGACRGHELVHGLEALSNFIDNPKFFPGSLAITC